MTTQEIKDRINFYKEEIAKLETQLSTSNRGGGILIRLFTPIEFVKYYDENKIHNSALDSDDGRSIGLQQANSKDIIFKIYASYNDTIRQNILNYTKFFTTSNYYAPKTQNNSYPWNYLNWTFYPIMNYDENNKIG
jgi:hypothetical protein